MSAARQLESQVSYDVPAFLNKSTPKAVRKRESQLVPAIITLTMMLLLFSVLILVVYRYATIAETKYSIFTLKKEIKELSMKKDELIYQIDTSVALDNVERISSEQLGMSYPNQGQMIYIQAANDYNLAVADVMQGKPKSEQSEDFVDQIAALAARFKR